MLTTGNWPGKLATTTSAADPTKRVQKHVYRVYRVLELLVFWYNTNKFLRFNRFGQVCLDGIVRQQQLSAGSYGLGDSLVSGASSPLGLNGPTHRTICSEMWGNATGIRTSIGLGLVGAPSCKALELADSKQPGSLSLGFHR